MLKFKQTFTHFVTWFKIIKMSLGVQIFLLLFLEVAVGLFVPSLESFYVIIIYMLEGHAVLSDDTIMLYFLSAWCS